MIARPFPSLGASGIIGPRVFERPLPSSHLATHLGRTALVHALRAFGVREGDQVLLPALHCGVEAEAVRFLRGTPCFYPVTSRFGIEADEVERRVGNATRAVLATHVFGIPLDLGPMAEICRGRGIPLIEDCAHVFWGDPVAAGGPGSFGEAAIYSLPKFLPVPDGGVLALRKGWPAGIVRPSLVPPPSIPLARRTTRLLLDRLDETQPAAAWIARAMDPMRRAPEGRSGATGPPRTRRYDPGSSAFDPRAVDRSASCWTRRILARVNLEAISRRRGMNYCYLSQSVSRIDGALPAAPELESVAAPMVLPIRVSSAEAIAAKLRALGVGTYRFGAGVPAGDDPESFPEAETLRTTVLGLPIHQNLEPRQLDKVAAALRRSLAPS